MKLLFALCLLVVTNPSFASTLIPEFQSLAKGDFVLQNIQAENIIFDTGDDYILKSTLTDFARNDYYYIQLPPHRQSHNWFLENTHVVLNKPGQYLVVKIQNKSHLEEVAMQAHHEGHACGMIQKLSPLAIELNKKSAPELVHFKRADVSTAVSLVQQDQVMNTIDKMVTWKTRYHKHPQGSKTGAKLKQLYQDLLPSGRNDVEIELVDHQGTGQNSLVVRILGEKDPEKLVILGSHLDSINNSNNDDAPGADDNASGTSVNLEAFRVLMEQNYRPQRTIEIHAYAAEEIGLVGSKEMAESYRNRNKQVISMVQMDMSGYADSSPKVTFVSNKTDRSLTQQLTELVNMYLEIPATSKFLLFGSSDHASWDRQGFPVAFPTEDTFNFNNKIHTNQDTVDFINSPKQITEFAKLAVAYLMHFGE